MQAFKIAFGVALGLVLAWLLLLFGGSLIAIGLGLLGLHALGSF